MVLKILVLVWYQYGSVLMLSIFICFLSYFVRIITFTLYIFQDIPEKEINQTTMDSNSVIDYRDHNKPGFSIALSFSF